MKKPGAWLVGVCAAILAGIVVSTLLRRSAADSVPAGPERPRAAAVPDRAAAPAPASSPAVPESRAAEPEPKKEEISAEALHSRFTRAVPRLQMEAYADLQRILKSQGGRVALSRIQEVAAAPGSGMEAELRAAYYVRLTAWVGSEDPASAAAAVRLASTLASDPKANLWVRGQALAALGGVPSTSPVASSNEDGSDFYFGFVIALPRASEGAPGPMSQAYRASLKEGATADPSVRLLLSQSLAAESAVVRRAAAAAMGSLEVHSDPAALAQASTGDPDAEVRRLSAASLVRLQSPDSLAVLRTMALQDPNDQVRQAAVRLLPDLAGSNPEVVPVLARALSGGADSDKPAAVAAAFALLRKQPDARAIDDALVVTLLSNAGRTDLLRAYVRNVGDAAAPEYLPLLRSAVSSLPDADARAQLEEGLRGLERPLDPDLGRRIEGATAQVSALWKQYGDPKTSAEDRRAVGIRITESLRELQSLRKQSPR